MNPSPPLASQAVTQVQANAPSYWDRFVTAQTSDAFCDAWLGLVCEKFPYVTQAAILVEGRDGQSFVPIAAWPAAHADMARMGTAVQKALGERRAVLVPPLDQPGVLHVATPLSAHDRIAGAVVLEVVTDAETVRPLLRELHWGSAWLSNLLGKREHDAAVEARARSMGILEAVAVGLRHRRFQQMLFELSNELRQRFHCSRVAIALVRAARVKLVALSEVATFEKSSPMVRAYVDAMAEACDLSQIVEAARPGSSEASESYRAHTALLQRVGCDALITVPVATEAQTVALITLERDGNGFSDDERQWLETFAALFAPIVVQRRDAERNSLRRAMEEISHFCGELLGHRHLLWKTGALLALLLIALLAWLPVPYSVTAKTVVEGSVRRMVAAPFSGYIAASFVRAGDVVTKNQVLAELDDRELLEERAKWASNRDQYNNKLREALAGHSLTAIQIVTAQRDEAQAQWDLVEAKLARAKMRAPYDGVVVSGDLSQQIGTPVKTGKELFEVAPLHHYRVILEVDERDVGWVHDGQTGQLRMTGLADRPMDFTVARIMPVATAQGGKNFYRVEARLPRESPLLLPGMGGVGRIHIGRRKLGWVLLHRLYDWLCLELWSRGL